MWYRLFHAFGKVARLVVEARALGLWQGRGRARSTEGGKRGRNVNDLLEDLLRLDDHRLSSAAVAGAVETSQALLNRPSVRALLEGAVLKLLGGTAEQFGSIEAVRKNADRVALVLQERGVVPNRIGVDGLPGSGKSTLGRALADSLGLIWKSLDDENMNVPRDFTQERTIYEHHRLFRTQDADVFDVIVYADESVDVSKARVLQRAREETRESLIIDMLDYEKLHKIGKLAFRVCQGEPISIPGSRLFMKVRPPLGFRAAENIARRLHAAGHQAKDLTKEEMLFLLVYGRARSGLTAYVLPGAYNQELLQGLVAGMRRYLTE